MSSIINLALTNNQSTVEVMNFYASAAIQKIIYLFANENDETWLIVLYASQI